MDQKIKFKELLTLVEASIVLTVDRNESVAYDIASEELCVKWINKFGGNEVKTFNEGNTQVIELNENSVRFVSDNEPYYLGLIFPDDRKQTL